LLVMAGGWFGSAAHAQFSLVPSPLGGAGTASEADNDLDAGYRGDGARHIYASYPMRIYKGQACRRCCTA
jgi:protein TonB